MFRAGERVTRATRQRFEPRVEALEDRSVPTATAFQSGNVITITGNNQADTINIVDNGLSSAGAITITGTLPNFSSTAVPAGTSIILIIDTKGGNDVVSYKVTGNFNRNTPGSSPPTPVSATAGRIISARLGTGDDMFNFDGDDTTTPNPFDRGFNVFNSSLQVIVSGDQGNDRIGLRYEGDIRNGRVDLQALGGSGDDIVAISEAFTGLEGATNNALVDGQAGADTLGLVVFHNKAFFPENTVFPPGGPPPNPTQFTGSTARLVGTNADKGIATNATDVFVTLPAKRVVLL